MTRLKCAILIVYSLFLVCSCTFRHDPEPSGFLGGIHDYQRLRHNDSVGLKYYERYPNVLSHYQTFSVDPVTVYMESSGKPDSPTKKKVQRLADGFRNEIVAALGDSYSIEAAPAEDMAIIRVAITGIKRTSANFGQQQNVNERRIELGNASMEAEIIDSVSRQRIVAAMDVPPNVFENRDSLETQGSTQEIFRTWAELLGRAVRTAQTRTNEHALAADTRSMKKLQ